jgi:hypothetical protein
VSARGSTGGVVWEVEEVRVSGHPPLDGRA